MSKTFTLRRLTIVLLTLLTFTFTESVKAQDSIRVNLDQALEIALSDNPTVKIANNQIELKKYAKKETISGLFPNLSASGSYSQALQLQKMKMSMGDQTIEIALGQKYTMQGQFSLSLPVIAPQLWKAVQLSEQDVELSLESSRSSKIDLIKQVKNAYYTYLLVKDSYNTLLAGYNTASLNAKNITDMYNQGLVSEYDKLVADVSVKNQLPNVVSTKNAVRLSELQLKILIGVDINEPIIFEGSLTDYELQMLANLETLKSDTSLKDNTTIRQIDLQAKQLELAEQINKMGYFPTLGLGLTYGWQTMNNNLEINHYEWYPGSTLALQLSIPIFDGLTKHYKTKQNQISMLTLKETRANTINQLELGIVSALNNIDAAVESLSSNKEVVIQSEKAHSISQKRYNIGSGTLLELNSAETSMTQSRLQYAQSIYDFLSAKNDLESLLGKTVVNEEE